MKYKIRRTIINKSEEGREYLYYTGPDSQLTTWYPYPYQAHQYDEIGKAMDDMFILEKEYYNIVIVDEEGNPCIYSSNSNIEVDKVYLRRRRQPGDPKGIGNWLYCVSVPANLSPKWTSKRANAKAYNIREVYADKTCLEQLGYKDIVIVDDSNQPVYKGTIYLRNKLDGDTTVYFVERTSDISVGWSRTMLDAHQFPDIVSAMTVMVSLHGMGHDKVIMVDSEDKPVNIPGVGLPTPTPKVPAEQSEPPKYRIRRARTKSDTLQNQWVKHLYYAPSEGSKILWSRYATHAQTYTIEKALDELAYLKTQGFLNMYIVDVSNNPVDIAIKSTAEIGGNIVYYQGTYDGEIMWTSMLSRAHRFGQWTSAVSSFVDTLSDAGFVKMEIVGIPQSEVSDETPAAPGNETVESMPSFEEMMDKIDFPIVPSWKDGDQPFYAIKHPSTNPDNEELSSIYFRLIFNNEPVWSEYPFKAKRYDTMDEAAAQCQSLINDWGFPKSRIIDPRGRDVTPIFPEPVLPAPTRLYRVTSLVYSHGEYSGPEYKLNEEEYFILSETEKGYWIDTYVGKRWVSKTSKRRYAHPTLLEAYQAFIARRTRANAIMKAQIHNNAMLMSKAKGVVADLSGPRRSAIINTRDIPADI